MLCHYCLLLRRYRQLSRVVFAFTSIAICTVIPPPLTLLIIINFFVHHLVFHLSFVHSPSRDSKSSSSLLFRCYIDCRHQSGRNHKLFVLNEESEVEFFSTFHQNELFWHFTYRLMTSFWICAAIHLSNENHVIKRS